MSAGGVAYRRGPDGIEVVVVGRHEPERWVLPKGTPNTGESLDQTAVREVAEETGIQVRLIRPLHDIQYWFVLHGVRHYKTVHFYLMEAVGGDTSLHDHEYDESFTAFGDRVEAAAGRLADRLPASATALVVTSGGPIARLAAGLLGGGTEVHTRLAPVIVNASVTKVVVGRRGSTLVSFDDHGHLEGTPDLLTYR